LKFDPSADLPVLPMSAEGLTRMVVLFSWVAEWLRALFKSESAHGRLQTDLEAV
jgi:hypothetical protein